MSETTTTEAAETSGTDATPQDVRSAPSDELAAVDAEGTRDGESVAAADDSVGDPGAPDGESAGDDDGADPGQKPGSGRGKTSIRRLEEEGEVAADYLEELLDIADLDGDIDIDVENGRASVAIVGEDGSDRELRRLVGSRGEVLEALQELSRLAVQARTGERSRMMLDIAGFRAARRRKLEDVAARACQEVKHTGQAYRLEPMTAFERKVVHDVVAVAGLISESEGEDPGRRVVIHPASA